MRERLLKDTNLKHQVCNKTSAIRKSGVREQISFVPHYSISSFQNHSICLVKSSFISILQFLLIHCSSRLIFIIELMLHACNARRSFNLAQGWIAQEEALLPRVNQRHHWPLFELYCFRLSVVRSQSRWSVAIRWRASPESSNVNWNVSSDLPFIRPWAFLINSCCGSRGYLTRHSPYSRWFQLQRRTIVPS